MRALARPPFQALEMFGYDLIMVDPPWPTKMRSEKGEKKSSGAKYGSMSFEAIGALPVGELLSRNGIVFLWGIWPMVFYGGDPDLRYADADASRSRIGECAAAWGLRYLTGGAWTKTTVHGKIAFGPGYRARSSCEPWFLFGAGKPETSRSARNWFDGLRRRHSEKPENAYAWCEAYMPGARRLELFSRTSRAGWDTWGYEAGKFDPVVVKNASPIDEAA